jgi:hypothetical protein
MWGVAMDLGNFVREQNVLRFSQSFEIEHDPIKRERLKTLMLHEENKFAATAERLDKTDREIAKCEARVARQHALIEELRKDGHDIQVAKRLVDNMIELHDLYVGFRLRLLEELNRTKL